MERRRTDSNLALELTQRQRLKLSPLQVRYGGLLEMSAPELEDEVRTAVEENPALEVVDQPETRQLPPHDETREPAYGGGAGYSADDERWEPQPEATRPTLVELLNDQLGEIGLTPDQIEIARYVVGNLDSNGYLRRSSLEMASDLEVAGGEYVPWDAVENVVDIMIERLDPAGVCCSSLPGCLWEQLRRMKCPPGKLRIRDAAMRVCTERALYDLFVKRHLDKLAARLRFDDREICELNDMITSLNPRPGASVAPPGESELANVIEPDFVVEREGGRFVVTVPSRVPELALSESFDMVAGPHSTPREAEAAKAMAPYRDEALTLIKALKMRHATMISVMKAIVGLQKPFFTTNNKRDIKPMLLKDVAALTGLDLSTVSRATSGKYVLTDGGVYKLRALFNERSGADSELTAHAVMDEIARMIKAEDPANPLGDEAIAEELGRMGLKTARRTVAKYREQMGLPVARMRRGKSRL